MTLVCQEKIVLRKKIKEGIRSFARFSSGNMSRVIFNSLAKSHLLHHLEVIFCSHANALGLDKFAILFKPSDSIIEFLTDSYHRSFKFFLRANKLLGRVKNVVTHLIDNMSAPGIDRSDAIDFITKKFNSNCGLLQISWPHFDDITTNSKMTPFKSDVVPFKKKIHKLSQKFITPKFLSLTDP